MNINAHYISSNFELRKKVLGVAESKEKNTAKNYRSKVDSVLTEFGLISRTFCHTTDNENKMNAAFRAKERNGCLAHIESKSCKKVVNEIERRQKLKGLKTRTLKNAVQTRFTSEVIMIRSFLNDTNENTNLELDEEKVNLNIEAINESLSILNLKKSEMEKLTLDKSDSSKLKEMVKLLDVLEECVTLVGGEKYSSGSCVYPFVETIKRLMEVSEDDPLYLSSFK